VVKGGGVTRGETRKEWMRKKSGWRSCPPDCTPLNYIDSPFFAQQPSSCWLKYPLLHRWHGSCLYVESLDVTLTCGEQEGFYDEENFVDERWVRKELNKVGRRCYHCNVELSWTGNTQFSIDRYDNDMGHTKSNCSVICVSCNKGKH
jgi:hypothetical protein